jgi:hypothetical protein
MMADPEARKFYSQRPLVKVVGDLDHGQIIGRKYKFEDGQGHLAYQSLIPSHPLQTLSPA